MTDISERTKARAQILEYNLHKYSSKSKCTSGFFRFLYVSDMLTVGILCGTLIAIPFIDILAAHSDILTPILSGSIGALKFLVEYINLRDKSTIHFKNSSKARALIQAIRTILRSNEKIDLKLDVIEREFEQLAYSSFIGEKQDDHERKQDRAELDRIASLAEFYRSSQRNNPLTNAPKHANRVEIMIEKPKEEDNKTEEDKDDLLPINIPK